MNKGKKYFWLPKKRVRRDERRLGIPRGKIEPGETPQEALKREIQEELDTKIKVGSLSNSSKQSKLITPEKEV